MKTQQIVLSDRLRGILLYYAEKEDISMSDVIRRALEEYFDKRGELYPFLREEKVTYNVEKEKP